MNFEKTTIAETDQYSIESAAAKLSSVVCRSRTIAFAHPLALHKAWENHPPHADQLIFYEHGAALIDQNEATYNDESFAIRDECHFNVV